MGLSFDDIIKNFVGFGKQAAGGSTSGTESESEQKPQANPDEIKWQDPSVMFDRPEYETPNPGKLDYGQKKNDENSGTFKPSAETVDFSDEIENASNPFTKSGFMQLQNMENENLGNAALKKEIGFTDPYSSMNIGGTNYSLEQDADGNWFLPEDQRERLNRNGYVSGGNGYLKANFGTNASTGKYNWQPGDVVTLNGEVIQDPTEYERAFYNWMKANEGRLAEANGGKSIGDSAFEFQTNRNLDYLWNEMMHDLHNMTDEEGQSLGFYDDVFTDPMFLDENGEFDYDLYNQYIRTLSLADLLGGRLDDRGNDWITSGGLPNAYGIAKNLAVSKLPFRITDEMDDELTAQLRGDRGTLDPNDDSDLAKRARAFEKYGFGKEGAIMPDDEGNKYVSLDPELGFEWLMSGLIEDNYTNQALPESYGYGDPRASALNQTAEALGLKDRYDTLPEDYEGEMPYFGEPMEYRNPWRNRGMDELLDFVIGNRFNPAANAAVNNPRLNRRQY